MKTKIRITGFFLLMIILIIVSAACNDDDSSGAKLSFSRSIYILPSNGSLEVELRASVAPETDLSIPVIIEGTAILDEDYEISANGFMIKAGETSATLTITPKNNLTANREIRLSINPVSGYTLGDKKIAIIPVEVKEHIMYTFKPVIYRLLSEIDIRIEVEGENSGSSFRATTDIVLPIEIDPSSTAILNEDFELENGITSVTIPKGSYYTRFKIKIKEGAEDYTGKNAILELGTPVDNSELYYPGSFVSYNIKLDQLKFTDMLGKWKPVEIKDKDNYVYVGMPDEDWINSLPENNGANDYLEFVHQEDGTDKIIPYLTGDLKDFFCNPQGHTVVFDHIEKGIYNWIADEEYDAPYFTTSQVNRCFSKRKTELGNAFIGLDKIDDNNIIIYFHDFIPTDFFSSTFEEYGHYFDASFFGITYAFTRVVE